MSDAHASPSIPAATQSARSWFQQLIGHASQMPDFGPGDQVRVWYRIKERDRVRLAPFEGLVIRRRGSGISETFTVRRITYGEGVERVFPLHTPTLDHVEVLRQGRVHRARLYFLRTKIGKTKIDAAKRSGVVSDAASQALAPEPSPDVTPSESPASKP